MTRPEPLAAPWSTLDSHGLCADDLRREAKAVALFGSRAHGCAHARSDWDLLCIGSGRSRRIGGLDILWVEERRVIEAAWLSGDLAGHVAAYGVWLHGEQPWAAADVLFGPAARRKEASLSRRIRAISTTWPHLMRPYRERAATLLLRDIQRLDHLSRGVPVPPTVLLDTARANGEPSSGALLEVLTWLGAAPPLAEHIAQHARQGV